MAFYKGGLGGVEPVWLLTVTYTDQPYRFSQEPVTPLDADGAAVPHDGGLPPIDRSERYTLGNLEPELDAVPIRELVWPEDLALEEVEGRSFSTATAELSRWVPGTPYEDRRVVVDGQVVRPNYGPYDGGGSPVSFSVKAHPIEDQTLIPQSTATVTRATWSSLTQDEGAYYPLPIGTPGAYTDEGGTTRVAPGSPGLLVDSTTVLIAGYEVVADEVTLFDSAREAETFTVVHTADGLGRRVATIDLTETLSNANFNIEDTRYWVGWHSGGGLAAPDGTALTGRGDLLRYLLQLSTLEVDYGRLEAAVPFLNRYKFSGYIDTPARPLDIIQQRVLKHLPVALVTGPDGVFPLVYNLNALARDAVVHLEEGQNVSRVSRVEHVAERRDIVNTVRVGWARDGMARDFLRRLVHTPEPVDGAPDEVTSLFAQRSKSRYGRQLETEITLQDCWDVETAGLIASDQVRLRGFIPRLMDFQGSSELEWVERGMVATLTSTSWHLTDRVVLVRDVQWATTGPVLTLWVLEDVERERYPQP